MSVAELAVAAGDDAARRAMIDSQLRPSGINEPAVLAAFARVAREAFVPAARAATAYADRAVPLGGDRVLAPAVSHGQLLSEAAPRLHDRALLIGGGTGYLAALLRPLVGSLQVVESDPALIGAAPETAGDWHEGPLEAGWPGPGPYSLIVIDGAVETLPAALTDQLADDGRLVTGLIERGVARLAAGRKAGGRIVLAVRAEADFAPLAAFAAPQAWRF